MIDRSSFRKRCGGGTADDDEAEDPSFSSDPEDPRDNHSLPELANFVVPLPVLSNALRQLFSLPTFLSNNKA